MVKLTREESVSKETETKQDTWAHEPKHNKTKHDANPNVVN